MATSDSRLPPPLDCSNLAKDWPKWKQNFHIYMIANNKNNQPEQNKIATFLWLIGGRGVEIYNTLYPNNGDVDNMFGAPAGGGVEANDDGGQQIQRTLAQVIEAFDGYCVPQRNVAMEAFKFNGITQKERQTFTDFETALRTQVAYCEYECAVCHASYVDRMLRDRIIIGIHDKMLQLKLLDGRNDSLAKVVETCKIFEAAAENKQLLDSKMPLSVVHTVEHPRETSETGGEVAVITRSGPKCYNCGQAFNRNHRRICPARNITCRGCNRQGHYQEFCISTRQQGNASADRSSSRGGAFSVRGSKSTGNKGVHSVNWVDTE
ncbi:uncharacterized protein LOC129743738 isoform X2 [Uranotaenia lowii]|uniref:uncharacterized protein LOC129743738 isoform X2 n=1 Tax=Uranotaenia lowii TaxID=190385 RepID=UPI0024790CCF|nr:uncharacterized protein LOC129743738 isoform X2 [Uranotaenia lowii]